MSNERFSNQQQFINWIIKLGGKFENNILYISSFSGYNVIVDGLSDLSLQINEKSHSSILSIEGSSLIDIQNYGKVKLSLNKVFCSENVISDQEHVTLKDSNINILKTREFARIENCTINRYEQDGGSLVCEKTAIKSILLDTVFKLNLDINSIKECEIKNLKGLSDCKISLNFLRQSIFIANNCNFSNKVKFEHCNFSETILYSYYTVFNMESYLDIKWFKKIRRLNSKGEKTKIVPRDECCQLKNIAKRNENSIDEDYFRAFELHALMQELRIFSHRFDTKFTLVLNNLSNRFGRSWLIPLILIFIIGLLFFIWYFHSTLVWEKENKCILDYLKYYWLFINPLHSFYLFDKEVTTGLSFFIDTFHRVLNYYLIYQFIAAFRKFGKV